MIGPKISKKDILNNEDVEEEVNPVLGEVPVPSTANTEEKRRKSSKGLKQVFVKRGLAEEEEQPVLQNVPSTFIWYFFVVRLKTSERWNLYLSNPTGKSAQKRKKYLQKNRIST
jgi:hypothetical protein